MECWQDEAALKLAQSVIATTVQFRRIADRINYMEEKMEAMRNAETSINAAALPVLERKLSEWRDIVFNHLCARIEAYLKTNTSPAPARDIATALGAPLAEVQEALDCLNDIVKVKAGDFGPSYGPKETIYFRIR